MEKLIRKANENNKGREKEKILLVDDDPEILLYLEEVVKGLNLKSIVAKTGTEAIEKFKHHLPVLVILDYNLPDINGHIVLNKIKELKPFTQVTMITGYGKYDVAVESLQSGATDYLKKPLKKIELIESIERSRRLYSEIYSAMETMNVLIVDKDSGTLSVIGKYIKNAASWNIVSAIGKKAYDIVKNGSIDIILLDLEEGGISDFDFLEEVKKIPYEIEVVVMSDSGDEKTLMEAVRRGAGNYIRKPDDFRDIAAILDKAKKSLELKRLCRFKINELKGACEIVAKITKDRNIEVDIFKPNSMISSSFAKRFFDSIPVAIVVVNENKNIIYFNRFFKKNCVKLPKRIDDDLMAMLKTAGIHDVSLDILSNEVSKLFAESEDIETIILGKKEFLTLTHLKIITEKGHINAVLMIVRVN